MVVNQKSFLSCAAILTTHNSVDTLRGALASILGQDHRPEEIFIVDDCSSDGTGLILNELEGLADNISVIRQDLNLGQSVARNRAALMCSSDVLIFFDDDDLSLPSRITEHLDHHEKGSDLVYVSSTKSYTNGYTVKAANLRREMISLSGEDLAARLILGKSLSEVEIGWIPASTLSVSREKFLELQGFDPAFRRLEDADFAIRAGQIGSYFTWSDAFLVNRKATFSSIKGGEIEMKFELELLEKHRLLLSEKDYKQGKQLIQLRRLYFGEKYFKLLLFVISHPGLTLRHPIRIWRFIVRFVHDLRKN